MFLAETMRCIMATDKQWVQMAPFNGAGDSATWRMESVLSSITVKQLLKYFQMETASIPPRATGIRSGSLN